jgi:hypothetical protein
MGKKMSHRIKCNKELFSFIVRTSPLGAARLDGPSDEMIVTRFGSQADPVGPISSLSHHEVGIHYAMPTSFVMAREGKRPCVRLPPRGRQRLGRGLRPVFFSDWCMNRIRIDIKKSNDDQ